MLSWYRALSTSSPSLSSQSPAHVFSGTDPKALSAQNYLNSIAAADLLKQYRHIVPSLGQIMELMSRVHLRLSMGTALCIVVKSSPMDFWASCEQDTLVKVHSKIEIFPSFKL